MQVQTVTEPQTTSWAPAGLPAEPQPEVGGPRYEAVPMLMFVSEISGPESEEDFATGFAEVVRPLLGEEGVVAGAWHDDEADRFIVQGLAEQPPADLIGRVTAGIGWDHHTATFRSITGLPGPRRTTYCEMPHNAHDLGSSSIFTCDQGHQFSDHRVTNCPVCGHALS